MEARDGGKGGVAQDLQFICNASAAFSLSASVISEFVPHATNAKLYITLLFFLYSKANKHTDDAVNLNIFFCFLI